MEDGEASRITVECGQNGPGLALKVDNGARYVAGLRPDWSSIPLLETQVYLNLNDLTLAENATIDLFHNYLDDRQTNNPAPVAVLQLGRRNGQLVARYQPAGQNQTWIPVPADRFFLLETTWDSNADRITLALSLIHISEPTRPY